MSIFSKAVYVEAVLPFKVLEQAPEDIEACSIDIEAYGLIGDLYKFYYASVGFNVKYYDELVEMLKSTDDKRVKIIAKTKNGIVKSFKIDFQDWAARFQDDRLKKGEIYGWGINDTGVGQSL